MPYRRDDCLFCKIVAGEIPADEVHRDDHVVAFRDIDPQAPTHILLVPTTHYGNAAEMADRRPAGLAALIVTAGTLADSEGIADRLSTGLQHRSARRAGRLPHPPAPVGRAAPGVATGLTPG